MRQQLNYNLAPRQKMKKKWRKQTTITNIDVQFCYHRDGFGKSEYIPEAEI